MRERYQRAALLIAATLGLLGLAYAYSRRMYAIELEIDALESIPVLDEEPV